MMDKDGEVLGKLNEKGPFAGPRHVWVSPSTKIARLQTDQLWLFLPFTKFSSPCLLLWVAIFLILIYPGLRQQLQIFNS
jgi:hypothetical protein